jgi:hypothetical protein
MVVQMSHLASGNQTEDRSPDWSLTRLKSPWPLLVLSLLLFAVALVPLTLAKIMPLADYPNHIARIYILQHVAHSAMLAKYYISFIHFQPNLAFDLGVLALGKFFPLWTAGTIFAGLSFVVIVSGVIALNRVLHGQWSLWPCMAFLLLYNRLFLWGFIDYLFTLGVALWGLAAWFALKKRGAALRIVAGTAFAFATYIGHMFAFGFYGLVIATLVACMAWEQYRANRGAVLREAVISFAPFILPVFIFFFVSPTGGAGGETYWDGITRSITAPFNIVQNYNLPLDAVTFAILIGLFVLMYFRHQLRVATPLLITFCVLVVVQLVMPDKLFSSYSADHRLPIAIALFAVAVSQPKIRSARWAKFATLALIALFLVRIAVIAGVWSRADARYQPYVAALGKLPYGARLSTIVVNNGPTWLEPLPVFEIGCVAVLSRDAFVANLFAYPKDAGQSVALTQAFRPVQEIATYHIFSPVDFALMRTPMGSKYYQRPMRQRENRYFDYYLVVHPKAYPLPIPANVRLLQSGPDFNIYRVDHSMPAARD